MDKTERLNYIRRRFKQLKREEELQYASISIEPTPTEEIEEVASSLETFKQYQKTQRIENNIINSDEH